MTYTDSLCAIFFYLGIKKTIRRIVVFNMVTGTGFEPVNACVKGM